MTDGTIDGRPGDGAVGAQPTAEELFGGIETESPENVDRTPTRSWIDDASRKRPTADAFARLRDEVSDDAANVLDGETPAEIADRADGPDPGPEPAADLRPDEAELEAVLLTDRREEDGFRWIDDDSLRPADEAGNASTDEADEPGGDGRDSTADTDPEDADDRDPRDADDADSTEDTDPDSAGETDEPGLLGRLRAKLPF